MAVYLSGDTCLGGKLCTSIAAAIVFANGVDHVLVDAEDAR
jgi:hypothetical protein